MVSGKLGGEGEGNWDYANASEYPCTKIITNLKKKLRLINEAILGQ